MDFEPSDLKQWQALTDLLAKIMDALTVGIVRYEAPMAEVLVTSRTPGNPIQGGARMQMDQIYCHEVVKTKKEVFIPNSRKEARWEGTPLMEMGLVAYLGLPLLFPDGNVFGTICVLDRRENHFSMENRELLFQIKKFLEAQLKLTSRKNEVVQRNLDLELIQENLIDLSQELKTKNKDLEDFVNFVSHDLKEPLRKIKYYSNKVRNADSRETHEQMLDNLAGSADRMERLIDSFLELSQVGAKPACFNRTDLNSILEEVIKSFKAESGPDEICIEKEELPMIEADPSQMHQLFLNLLSNSIKFKSEDRPCKVRIASVALPNDRCEIRVQDNGRGFNMKYAHQVFEPLKRLKNNSDVRGAGLGLAIAKKVVEFHKGSIRVESMPSQGTTFFISLPLSQKD